MADNLRLRVVLDGDRQGRIVKRYVGEPDFPALHALIEKLLAQQA